MTTIKTLTGGCLVFLLVSLALSGCYYDKADLVYPPSAPCDSTNITFSTTVQPIIQSKCYACHSGTAAAGGGIKLDSYAALAATDPNRLVGAISHQAGYSAMPKGGAKLAECDIAKIRIWIRLGRPNN